MNSVEQFPLALAPQQGRELALQSQPYAAPQLPAADRVRKLLAILRRRWLPFLGVFALIFGAIAIYTARQTPQFVATATLLVNSRVFDVASKENAVIPVAEDADRAVSTEVQILQSNQVAERVIKAVQAGPLPRFAEQLTELPRADAQDAVLDAVKGRTSVGRPGATNVLEVSFRSPDPAMAAIVANEFVRQYIGFKVDGRLSAAQSVDTGLRGELDKMRKRVETAEAAVASYRRANNLLSADGVTLTEQEQSLFKQQDAAAQTALAEERARLTTARRQLRRGSNGGDVGEALSSPVVNQLRGQRAVVSAQLAQFEARYQSDHPSVVRSRRELADVDQAIGAEISRVVSNLEARVQVAQQRAGAANSISGRSRGELANNAAATVGLNELERRADALRTNYAAMLQRQTAVSSQAVVADVDARLLSSALPPKRPVYPNRTLNYALGAMLGLVLAAAALALMHLLDQKIVSSYDLEQALGIGHLVNVPSIGSIAKPSERRIAPADFVVERPLSMIAESMRSLLLMVEKDGQALATRIVGITSARPGEGKSTLAACLARVSALSGRRTLLIDGDVRSPSIAAIFGVDPKVGLVDVLTGQASLKDAMVRDERSGAWLLPALPQTYKHGPMSSDDALQSLMSRLVNVFDLVVIDTAPALAVVESRLLMSYTNQAIMVVRWKHTPRQVAKAALKRLVSIGVRPMGVVMTQVDMKAVAAYAVDDVDHGYLGWAY